ncbi:MAG: hypothetical protein AAF744_02530 [Pseudomonadota bacterium]
MAYTNQTLRASPFSALTRAFSAAARGIAAIFDSFALALAVSNTAQARLEQAEQLQAKTDAELAEIGIARDDITRYVFRDLMWT